MLHSRGLANRGDIHPGSHALWHEPFHIQKHSYIHLFYVVTLALCCWMVWQHVAKRERQRLHSCLPQDGVHMGSPPANHTIEAMDRRHLPLRMPRNPLQTSHLVCVPRTSWARVQRFVCTRGPCRETVKGTSKRWPAAMHVAVLMCCAYISA